MVVSAFEIGSNDVLVCAVIGLETTLSATFFVNGFVAIDGVVAFDTNVPIGVAPLQLMSIEVP